MKSVFSCSDFLSDIWQGGPDAVGTLDPLASCPSEGGSTHLGRGKSTDLLSLLGQTEETDSHSRIMQSLAASSSNKDSSGIVNFGRQWPCICLGRLQARCMQHGVTRGDELTCRVLLHALVRIRFESSKAYNHRCPPTAGGQFFAGEPVDSNIRSSGVSERPMMSPERFVPKQVSTFPQYDQHPTQLQPLTLFSNEHVSPRSRCHSIVNKYLLLEHNDFAQELL